MTNGKVRRQPPSRNSSRPAAPPHLLKNDVEQGCFSCGGATVDLSSHVAWFSEGPVSLRRQEVRLLQLLAANARQIVTYEEIAFHLYSGVSFECAHTRLKSLVADVRRLSEGVREWLRTVHGVGLILYTDTAAEAESAALSVRRRREAFMIAPSGPPAHRDVRPSEGQALLFADPNATPAE